MKSFIAILLVALACLCLVQDANAWERAKTSDRFTCGTKNPDVVSAIENFCFKNKDMVVPSQRAKTGAMSNKGKIAVWIQGKDCKPPQWVPEKYCFQNFLNMCVNMSKNFKATAYYGKDGGCQAWRIKKM